MVCHQALEEPSNMGLQAVGSKRKLEDCEAELGQPVKYCKQVEEWDDDHYYFPSKPYVYQPPGDDYGHHWSYQSQQTIRCDKNGKSYLDLGSWNGNANGRCCTGKVGWCSRGPACYRQKRLAVLNISMCKLGRYRQFSDPSLHRSVLICNTLRLIEREMEQEGCLNSNNNSNSNNSTVLTSPFDSPVESTTPCEIPRCPTPYPTSVDDLDSGLGDDSRSINWGSVLSLSSQSDLDPLNNNGGLGDDTQDLDDLLPSWKLSPSDTSRTDSELDNLMHVLIGT
nr:PREDICTED: SERTA domain-containing protein 2 isoform X1 [Bemisia tabaci]